MADDAKKQLETAMAEMVEGLHKAGDFVIEQAPLLIQEFLTFAKYNHWVWVGVGALLAVGCPLLARYGYRVYQRSDGGSDPEAFGFCTMIGSSIASVVGLAILGFNLYWAIMVTVAPRVYLLYEMKGLLK